MKKLVLLVFIIAFFAAGTYLLLKQFSILGNSSTFQTELNKNQEVADPDARVFNITARQYSFTPSVLRVKRGERVILYLVSEDVLHGFFIPDYNIEATLEPHKEERVEFVADRVGEFEFHNPVYSGPGMDQMRGELIVE